MKKLSLLALVILASCNKPDPGPGPGPGPGPTPPKVMEFKVEGTTIVIEGKIKDGMKLTADEAKKQLAVAVSLLDVQ